MEDNYTEELDQECLDIIKEYKDKGKLHPNYLPFTTYDMVQCGYPIPNHGRMIARDWGGTDEERRLLPSDGKWCKVEDVINFLNKCEININELI